MKDVYMQEMVRKAYFRDKKSKRQIARELGIHRDTVTRLLERQAGERPRYRIPHAKARPVTGMILGVIEAWLKADEEAPRKQQHTAQRIYRRLQEEYGFQGSERRIREIVAELRQKPKESFLPLGFQPGEMAQVDWAEVTVNLAGVRTKVQLFCLVLNYSGALYCQAFERANQEAFFEGHTQAFAFLGGVPKTITYDNLTSAVKKILQGKNREENERFVVFRSGWLFDSRFCRPAKGNEKGRVENMVKYAERNLFTPVPCVNDLQELNVLLRERCRAYQRHIQARQNQTVGERLQAEQPALLPIPTHPPECCRIVSLKADKSALVQFETNRYSVPSEYAYQMLWLKAFVDRIEITNRESVIARHARLLGRFQESIRFEHYRKTLERKPGGLQHLRAIDKEPLPEKVRKPEPSRYPQVYVRPPNLSMYRQLLTQ
ncbi:MAG TPA: IS21 family transposase [Coleofasciculaceae cyanobacterium]